MAENIKLDLATDWRRPSNSDGMNCGEFARTTDGRVAFRDSDKPETVVVMSSGSARALAQGIADGEFDDIFA